MTIHNSKGLEFPIVFCPFSWKSGQLTDVLFHRDHQLVIDLGSNDIKKNRLKALDEVLAEDIRLLYVALTRAKNRCYMVWGRLPSADYSALAYLMYFDSDSHPEDIFWERLQVVARTLRNHDSRQHRQAIEDLARRSSGARSIPTSSWSSYPTRCH